MTKIFDNIVGLRDMTTEEQTQYDTDLADWNSKLVTRKLSKIKNTFKYANKYNTFFFSEYNSGIISNFDFATGIGKGRCGLLLNKVKPSTRIIKNPYAFM